MTKANWKEAPHDAETYEQDLAMGYKHFCKPGFYWSDLNNRWYIKPKGMTWSALEHRPLIIAWEDMKEGMVVRCLHSEGSYNYKAGKCYPVGLDEYGDFGPLDDDGHAPPWHYIGRYAFELVSESEQRKTAKDAVDGDWVNHNGKETLSPSRPIVGYDPEDDLFFSCEQGYFSPTGGRWEYQVCTREEFEAEVNRLDPNNWDVLIDSSEDDGDEWALKEGAGRNLKGNFSQFTHVTTEGGVKCRVLCEHSDSVWVLTQDGRYETYYSSCLEPIKPTITKAEFELLEKTRQYFDIDPKDFAKFMNDYEVK